MRTTKIFSVTILFLLMAGPNVYAQTSDEDLPSDAPIDADASPEEADDPLEEDDANAGESSFDDASSPGSEAETASDADAVDYRDEDARNSHAEDICDAACEASSLATQCHRGCVDQIQACFEQCETLTTKQNDCFISCTHIAVDEREYQEEQAARLAEYLDVEEVYGRPFAIGFNVFGAIHNVPGFVIDLIYERNMHHWEDRAKFIYGGELVLRFHDTHDLLISIDNGQYTTPDGWWVRKNKDATAVEWVHNDMTGIAIVVAWNGIHNFDKKKRIQLYGGVGLGALIKRGDFNKSQVRLGCVLPETDMSVFDTMTPTGSCPEDNGDVLTFDENGEPVWEAENIPAVLPLLTANVGFRYLIADMVSIGVEAGFRTISFYGGAKIGFIFGKSAQKSALEERQQKVRETQENAKP